MYNVYIEAYIYISPISPSPLYPIYIYTSYLFTSPLLLILNQFYPMLLNGLSISC